MCPLEKECVQGERTDNRKMISQLKVMSQVSVMPEEI